MVIPFYNLPIDVLQRTRFLGHSIIFIFVSIAFFLFGVVNSSIKHDCLVPFPFEFGYFSEDACRWFFGFIVVSFGSFAFDDDVIFEVEFNSLSLGWNSCVFLICGFKGCTSGGVLASTNFILNFNFLVIVFLTLVLNLRRHRAVSLSRSYHFWFRHGDAGSWVIVFILVTARRRWCIFI